MAEVLLLEELRNRHQVAQSRLAETTQIFQHTQQALTAAQANFQKATQALQNAQQQFQAWTVALNTVANEEAARQKVIEESQLQLPATDVSPVIEEPSVPEIVSEAAEPINKTDIIRVLLKQHPTGMTPLEIWSSVKDQFKHRAYLYSVLKRLTDREELCIKRGKYALKVKPEGGHETTMLQ